MLKGLVAFIKRHTCSFVIIAITQIIAIVAILLSYVTIANNAYSKKEEEDLETSICYSFNAEKTVMGENSLAYYLKKNIPSLVKKHKDIVDSVCVNMNKRIDGVSNNVDMINAYVYFQLDEEGNIIAGDGTSGYGSQIKGRYFSDEEIKNGENVCILSNELYYKHPDIYCIGNREYKVIGYGKTDSNLDTYFPFMAMPDIEIRYIDICLKRALLPSEYRTIDDELKRTFEEHVDDIEEQSEHVLLNVNEKMSSRSLTLISILMSFLGTMTTWAIYCYILEKRKKDIMVYMICGAPIHKVVFEYLREIVTILVFCIGVGVTLFIGIVRPILIDRYTWTAFILKPQIYCLTSGVYLFVVIVSLYVAISNIVRKTPAKLLKG